MRKAFCIAAAAALFALGSTNGAAAETVRLDGLVAAGEPALCTREPATPPPIPFTPALSRGEAATCRLSDVVLQEMADHLRRTIGGDAQRAAPARLQLG